MIGKIFPAGVFKPKPADKQLVDITFDNTYFDTKLTTEPVIYGYPGGVPVFNQVDGKGALRVRAGQGISFHVIPGKPRLLDTPDWRFEFEARMVDPSVFKHEPILAMRRAPLTNDYNFFFWKHAQTNHTMIVTGDKWKVQTAPMFADNGPMAPSVWRKFAVEHKAVDNTTRFYVNDILRGSRVSTSDVSCDVIEIVKGTAPDFFDGWVRNIKVFREL